MKVKEKFPLFGETNLFQLMNVHRPFLWAEIYTPLQMDNYFILTIGEHRLNPAFESVTNETIANMLAEMYVEKWNKIYSSVYGNEFILGGFSETITENYEEDTTQTETENNTNTNTISAYDSNTFENNEKDTIANSRSNAGSLDGEKTRTRQGYNSTYVNNINTLLNIFANKFIYDIIIADVKKVLVNPIY